MTLPLVVSPALLSGRPAATLDAETIRTLAAAGSGLSVRTEVRDGRITLLIAPAQRESPPARGG